VARPTRRVRGERAQDALGDGGPVDEQWARPAVVVTVAGLGHDALLVLVRCFLDGTAGPNRYDPSRKGAAA